MLCDFAHFLSWPFYIYILHLNKWTYTECVSIALHFLRWNFVLTFRVEHARMHHIKTLERLDILLGIVDIIKFFAWLALAHRSPLVCGSIVRDVCECACARVHKLNMSGVWPKIKVKDSETHWSDLVSVFVDIVRDAIWRHLKMTPSFEQHFLLIAHLLFPKCGHIGEARRAYVTKKTKDHKNCYIFTTFHVYSFYIHSQCDTDTHAQIWWGVKKEMLSIDLAIYIIVLFLVWSLSVMVGLGPCTLYLSRTSFLAIVAKQQPYNIQMGNSFSCFIVAAIRYV